MIRALVTATVGRPVTVLMAFIALLLLGAIAVTRIPLQLMPDGFVMPNLWVQVAYNNATPQETEAQITRPVEEQLATISGLQSMSSDANATGSSFDLEFSRDTDMDAAYNDVVDRMERSMSELPTDADRYWVWRWNPADQPIVLAGVSLPDDLEDPYWALTQVVQRRLERVSGVGKVEVWGASEKRVAVDLDLRALQQARISLYTLMGTLRQDNFQRSNGRLLDRGQIRYVRSLSRWQTLDDLRALPITAGVRLGDVAKIELRPETQRNINHINGKEGAALAVYKESGANTVSTAGAVAAAMGELEADRRVAGSAFYTFFDQGKLIRSSLNTVLRSAAEGGLIAVVVLLLFLRDVRMTLLIAACIPFCTLLTVMVLHYAGQSLNIISLMGLMLAVGMVVDDAIVVVESIYLYRQAGLAPREAAALGTSEVGLAVVLSTATSMVVFLPVMFMSGDAMFSFFMTALGFPVVFALTCSLGVALLFTPLTTTLVQLGGHQGPSDWSRRMTEGYRRVLRWLLARRSDTGFGIFAILALTVLIPAQSVSCEGEAEGGLNDFRIRYEVPAAMSPDQKREVVHTVEALVDENRARWGVEVHRTEMNLDGTVGRTYVTLLDEPPEGALSRAEVLEDAKDKLPDLPGVQIRVGRTQDTSQNATLSLSLRGEDTATLQALGEAVRARLEHLPGVLAVHADVEREGPQEVRLHLDRDASARQALSSAVVGGTVGFALRGSSLSPLVLPDREIAVSAGLTDAEHTELDALLDFPVGGAGGSVPLRAVVRPEVGPGLGGIHRDQRETAWPLTVDLDANARQEQVRGAVAAATDSLELPQGYRWDWGFRAGDDEDDPSKMLSAVGLSVVFVFVIMGMLFESFLLPLAIITTVPMALIGVYWTLHLTRTPLDVMGWIGLVVLVGIVVKNGIVMLDQVQHRRAEGLSREEALIEAGGRRLRPVLMTALATIGGILPMALGESSLMGIPYAPLGLVIAGGMVAGTLLTLFFLPYLYLVLDDMRVTGGRWLAWVVGR